jgi:hypothetical protein
MARRTMDNVRSEGRIYDVVDDDYGFFLGGREATYITQRECTVLGCMAVRSSKCFTTSMLQHVRIANEIWWIFLIPGVKSKIFLIASIGT